MKSEPSSLGWVGSHQIECIGTDKGGEFLGTEFNKLIREECGVTIHETSCAGDSTGGNPVVERMIRTVTESARASLLHAGAPSNMMGAAINHAVHQRNRLPTKGNPDGIPPLLACRRTREPSDIRFFRPFFSPVCYKKLKRELPRRHKGASRAHFGRFLGFSRPRPVPHNFVFHSFPSALSVSQVSQT